MKINNVAFLIPIHPPHYHYLYNLIHKCKNHNIVIDIFLIFSNRTDYNAFQMKQYIKPIICDSVKTKSIVTYKKFFGLKHLSNSNYDYIICCDSEIDILCENFTNENIHHKINQLFYHKKIYAGEHKTVITKTSANLFPEYDVLKKITNDFTLYFWWSDLPVYRRSDIIPFFNKINYDNIVWEHFDYIIYQYYLILYHDFKIINITPITNIHWSLEKLNTKNINILNQLLNVDYGFSWINQSMYDLNKQFIQSHGGFLIFHLDRSSKINPTSTLKLKRNKSLFFLWR